MAKAPTQSVRTLCAQLIDYAGLFPPASLGMKEAVENYARSIRGEHAWMLGRFICPASRLDEFIEHARVMLPGTWATSGYQEMAGDLEPWRLSVIIDGDLDENIDAIEAFNERHADAAQGLALADCIELKATAPGELDDAIDRIPESIHPYFEISPDRDIRGYIAALAGGEASAKIRCGGVRPEMIPPADQVAKFIHACALGHVTFKATAGLHHPVRAEHPLTYKPDAPRGVMHGFLNVFLAAALVKAGKQTERSTIALLEERDPGALHFTDAGASWNEFSVTSAEIASARERFAVGYGSCSFTEPVEDLQKLGLL